MLTFFSQPQRFILRRKIAVLKTLPKIFRKNPKKFCSNSKKKLEIYTFFQKIFPLPNCSSGQIKCSFDNPREFLRKLREFFCPKSGKVHIFENVPQNFFPKLFRIMWNFRFWFCWMLKLTFLRKNMVQIFHQGLSRQHCTWVGFFKGKNINVFRCVRSLTGQKSQENNEKLQNSVFKFITIHKYQFDFLYQESNWQHFPWGGLPKESYSTLFLPLVSYFCKNGIKRY